MYSTSTKWLRNSLPPTTEDDAVEEAYLILPLLIWIHECWCEFVEGKMWLVGIEEEIFFHLGMSLSSLWAYLMNLDSEVKGTTTYGLNGWNLSRWARNCLTTRVWFFNTITVRHWAPSTRLHGIENLEQKIMIRKFCEIQSSTPYIGIDPRFILGNRLTFRRAHSNPCSDHRPLINLGMIWFRLSASDSASHRRLLSMSCYVPQHVRTSSNMSRSVP